MPRNVRNFWLELEVDGKKQRIATGPRSAGGGFSLAIRIRSCGAVKEAAVLQGYVLDGDNLWLTFSPKLIALMDTNNRGTVSVRAVR